MELKGRVCTRWRSERGARSPWSTKEDSGDLRVLLVEPDYRKNSASAKVLARTTETTSRKKFDDELLWYPPLGLMKLATFHKRRGDEVRFVTGCDKSVFKFKDLPLFSSIDLWDRVYITTLFTYQWKKTIDTIKFYKDAVGGSLHKIFVGGIMASLMPNEIYEETNVFPVVGVLNSAKQISLDANENIDLLPPDYDILNKRLYAITDTYYAYTTRGCINKCEYCGVQDIEPGYINYIDIKSTIRYLREKYGDKAKLKLMDNNVLASPKLEQIVEDLVKLGYAKNQFTETSPKRARTIDFNQGLDASKVNEKTMSLLSKLNIRPMRIAFDNVKEKRIYERAVDIARSHGVTDFSNYMLYNWKDTPKDLYERLKINIKMNEKLGRGKGKSSAAIYSYPMRYAPIRSKDSSESSINRDYIAPTPKGNHNYLKYPLWTKRFTRNIEIMKGAAFGAISPTPTLARRTIGKSFKEFIANLYMPSELLRYRDKYERRVYKHGPKRRPGTGDVERFRQFIHDLLKKQDKTFLDFHNAVSNNTKDAIKEYRNRCKNKRVLKWLDFYLK